MMNWMAASLINIQWGHCPWCGPGMGWGFGAMGWVMMVLSTITGLLFLALLVLGIVWLARQLRLGGSPGGPPRT